MHVCGWAAGGVGVWLHIPHLVKGVFCTRIQTGQESDAWGGKRGEGGMSPFLPTSIGQNPADMVGEEEGGGRELFLYRKLRFLK